MTDRARGHPRSAGPSGYGRSTVVGPSPPAGDPIGSPFLVNTSTAGEERDGDVARNAAGRRVVVWIDEHDIYAQRFAADGTNELAPGDNSFSGVVGQDFEGP